VLIQEREQLLGNRLWRLLPDERPQVIAQQLLEAYSAPASKSACALQEIVVDGDGEVHGRRLRVHGLRVNFAALVPGRFSARTRAPAAVRPCDSRTLGDERGEGTRPNARDGRGGSAVTRAAAGSMLRSMQVFVALLRAVNVGGTSKLAMSALRQLCEQAGFSGVVTYIQSGNVVLRSDGDAGSVKRTLEAALAVEMGKPVAVLVRTRVELEAIVARNPFPEAEPVRVLVLFLDEPVPDGALADLAIPADEVVVPLGDSTKQTGHLTADPSTIPARRSAPNSPAMRRSRRARPRGVSTPI
jgi:uncharacterized protein (DUF1697 family)